MYKSHYENVPFEIPESWAWVTLSEVCEVARGGSPRPIKDYLTTNEDGVNWIKIGDTDKDGKYINSTKEKIIPEGVHRSRFVHKGDFLLTNSMSFGRPYILNIDGCIHDGWLVISPFANSYVTEFLYFLLSSSFAYDQFADAASGGVVSNLNSDKVANSYFPLPPEREQRRIINELNNWFKVVGKLDKNIQGVKSFVSRIKSKILDLAISGKLVPQDPNDEPAIELLKRINPGFEPCDNSHYENLPKGWAVCHLEDVCQICDNQRQPINSTERQERKKRAQTLYPYYGATGQVDWIDDYMLDGTFILLGEDGAPFLEKFADKAYVVSGKIWVNNHAHILKPNCDITYLTYYLNRYDYSECVNGSTRLKLTQADMKNMTIVLPPLAEQHRIAGRIDKIFRMLDAITAEL